MVDLFRCLSRSCTILLHQWQQLNPRKDLYWMLGHILDNSWAGNLLLSCLWNLRGFSGGKNTEDSPSEILPIGFASECASVFSVCPVSQYSWQQPFVLLVSPVKTSQNHETPVDPLMPSPTACAFKFSFAFWTFEYLFSFFILLVVKMYLLFFAWKINDWNKIKSQISL